MTHYIKFVLAGLALVLLGACGGSSSNDDSDSGTGSGSGSTESGSSSAESETKALPEVAGACAERDLDTGGEPTVIPGGGPLDVAGLPHQTWIEVHPGLELPPGAPETLRRNSSGRSFGNTTYRSGTGEIVYYESLEGDPLDLGDIFADAVGRWDLRDNMVRIDKITNWKGNSRSGGELQDDYFEDPTPAPRHSYESFQYIPGQDRLFFILGANDRLLNDDATSEAERTMARDFESTWIYDFGNNCWDQHHDLNVRQFWPSDREFTDYESRAHWLPSRQKMLVLNNRQDRAALYDPVAQDWEVMAEPDDFVNEPPTTTRGRRQAKSTWDDKRERWVFRVSANSDNGRAPAVYYFDPGNLQFQELPEPPTNSGNAIVYIGAAPGDPAGSFSIDRYLIFGDSAADTWVFDPDDWAAGWQHIDGGDVDFSELKHPYLDYDPRSGLVSLLFSGPGGYYVFKYPE